MPNSKNYDLDIDTTLGGSNASDYVIPSQKAIKTYVDNNSGSGGGTNTDLSNLTATGEAHFLKNESTGTNSITILGTPTSSVLGSTNIGYSSTAANNGTSYGYIAQASGGSSIAIGSNATASGNSAIQLGAGTNLTGNSLSVGFNQVSKNWQMLDGTTGLIPDARISSNIARTSQIPSTSGLANTSLSNLSSTGQKVLDGQWITANTTLTSATSATSTDCTSALKTAMGTAGTDSYIYELLLRINADYKSAASNVLITTSYISDLAIERATTNGGIRYSVATVIVGANKLLSVKRSAAMNACGVLLIAYRRIGTNT